MWNMTWKQSFLFHSAWPRRLVCFYSTCILQEDFRCWVKRHFIPKTSNGADPAVFFILCYKETSFQARRGPTAVSHTDWAQISEAASVFFTWTPERCIAETWGKSASTSSEWSGVTDSLREKIKDYNRYFQHTHPHAKTMDRDILSRSLADKKRKTHD